MLLRKRAWDMMREDFATIDESASLAEGIRTLRDSMKTAPDNSVVVVKRKTAPFAVLRPYGLCSKQ